MPKRKITERRYQAVEMRMEGDDSPRIVGYAAKFNSPSGDLGGFTEIIRRGAFAKTLQEADVRALWNHDSNYVLGRSKSGTLRLSEDDEGLRIEIDPPETQWAQDLITSIDRGDVDQMSFAFRAIQDKWTGTPEDPVRELLEVRLLDVSPVTYPAYEETEVSVRSIIDGRTLTDEEKQALRHLLPELSEPPLAGHSDVRRLRLAYRTINQKIISYP